MNFIQQIYFFSIVIIIANLPFMYCMEHQLSKIASDTQSEQALLKEVLEDLKDGASDQFAINMLCTAVKSNRGKIVEGILACKPDLINKVDEQGYKPIFYALDSGREMVELLLLKGAHCREVSPHGNSLLHYAIEKGKDDCAELIIVFCSKVDPSVRGVLEELDQKGNAPLHQAVRLGKIDLVYLLLWQGCTPEVCDAQRNTPLHIAMQEGHSEIMKLLLSVGAKIEVYNDIGSSPLHYGAARGDVALCKVLLHRPDMVAKLLQADGSIDRIKTAWLCINRWAQNMPRDVKFLIFTIDKDLIKDFAIMLLLGSYDSVKRVPSVSITNTSQWRLLIRYIQGGRPGLIVLGAGEKVLLDGRPAEFISLQAECYGDGWGKLAKAYDLFEGLRLKFLDHPDSDIDIQIDGGHGWARQYTRPFSIDYHSFKMADYEPVSQVPESRLLLDAFPLAKYKVMKKERVDARCILQLPSCEVSPEIVKEAYERLCKVWQKELDLNSANTEYVANVIYLLKASYEHIVQNKILECDSLGRRIEASPVSNDFTAASLSLATIFRKRSKLSQDTIVLFFENLCTEMVVDFMLRADLAGKTAYEIARESGQTDCIRLLDPGLIKENICDPLRTMLEKCLRRQKRAILQHKIDTPLSSLIAQRLGVSALGQSAYIAGEATASHIVGSKAGLVFAAPFIGAALPIYSVFQAANPKSALLQIAALPVTVSVTAIASIPLSLFAVCIIHVWEST